MGLTQNQFKTQRVGGPHKSASDMELTDEMAKVEII